MVDGLQYGCSGVFLSGAVWFWKRSLDVEGRGYLWATGSRQVNSNMANTTTAVSERLDYCHALPCSIVKETDMGLS